MTNTVKDSALAISQLKADPAKAIEHSVKGVAGLRVRVETSGAKTFYMRFRADGRQHRMKLGKVGAGVELADLSLRAARSKAHEVMAAVERGDNPALLGIAGESDKTVSEVWGAYRVGITGLSPITLQQYEAVINSYVLPAIGTMKANDVRPDHVRALLRKAKNKVTGKAITAAAFNNTKAAVGSMYRWARSELGVKAQPTIGIETRKVGKPRERNLQDHELAEIWNGIGTCDGLLPEMRLLLRVILLTGQRNSNISGLTTNEAQGLGSDNPRLVFKADRMKRKVSHDLPLPPVVAKMLLDARAMKPAHSEYVFASSRTDADHLSRRHVARCMEKVCEHVGVTDFHPHDARHTMTTWLATQMVPGEVRRAITHHGARDVHDRVYNGAAYAQQVRDALQMWADHVENIARGSGAGETAANVVQLRG